MPDTVLDLGDTVDAETLLNARDPLQALAGDAMRILVADADATSRLVAQTVRPASATDARL